MYNNSTLSTQLFYCGFCWCVSNCGRWLLLVSWCTDVVKWFADRADMIIIMFDAHKLDISDELKVCRCEC
jgi:hypothetical protein